MRKVKHSFLFGFHSFGHVSKVFHQILHQNTRLLPIEIVAVSVHPKILQIFSIFQNVQLGIGKQTAPNGTLFWLPGLIKVACHVNRFQISDRYQTLQSQTLGQGREKVVPEQVGFLKEFFFAESFWIFLHIFLPLGANFVEPKN